MDDLRPGPAARAIAVVEQQVPADLFDDPRRRRVEDARAFLRKGVAGDWCGRLDPPALRVVEEICGDLLFDYGYGAGGRPEAQIIQLRRG